MPLTLTIFFSLFLLQASAQETLATSSFEQIKPVLEVSLASYLKEDFSLELKEKERWVEVLIKVHENDLPVLFERGGIRLRNMRYSLNDLFLHVQKKRETRTLTPENLIGHKPLRLLLIKSIR
ncbi:MAG: hypothetical protein ACOYL6_16540 [Bacteriovoracaceae bacterium]